MILWLIFFFQSYEFLRISQHLFAYQFPTSGLSTIFFFKKFPFFSYRIPINTSISMNSQANSDSLTFFSTFFKFTDFFFK